MSRKRKTENLSETLGSKIIFERKKKGWSQTDLANEISLTSVTISSYERGTRLPDCDILCRLCKALSVSSDYLLGLEEINLEERIYSLEKRVNHLERKICEEGSL